MSCVGICLEGRYVLMEDDSAFPIVDMMDGVDGSSTQDCDAVAGIVIQLPTGFYTVLDLRGIDPDLLIKGTQS